MRPGEVLDAQRDLIERLDGSPVFRDYIGGWALSEFSTDGKGESEQDSILAVLRNHVRVAHTYRVSHDMSEMVEWMAAQLEDTDRFMPDLAPTSAGFVSFDKPLPVIDVRGRTMLTHFLVWGPAPVGVASKHGFKRATETVTAMWTFNDAWRQADEVQDMIWNRPDLDPGRLEMFRHAIGRWAPVGLGLGFTEQRLGPQMVDSMSEKHRASILADGDTPVPGTNAMRHVHALWLLLGQSIVSVTDEDVDRPARRRAGRAGLPPKVSVIRLRRSEQVGYDPDRGESLVEWQHRWIVRQHWRWQPYGPRKGTEHEHEYGQVRVEQGGLVRSCMIPGCENYIGRIIIPMSVKGPEGAPLVQSEKVYDLTR